MRNVYYWCIFEILGADLEFLFGGGDNFTNLGTTSYFKLPKCHYPLLDHIGTIDVGYLTWLNHVIAGVISLSYFWTTLEALRGQKLGAANGGPNA